MLKLKPVAEPISFSQSTKISNDKTVAKELFEAIPSNTPLLSEAVPKFPGGPHWRDFKDVLSEAQSKRCAYCEDVATGPSYGDVEHYRPKGRLRTLDKDNQGEEKIDLVNVKGRKFFPACYTGYWWLAYEWSNYLLSCAICNQAWKSDVFPVEEGTNAKSRPKPGCEDSEKPLLINPFFDDPFLDIEFKADGTVRALSPRGLATIQTVGLWRPSLTTRRGTILKMIERNIKSIVNHLNNGGHNNQSISDAVKTILEFGDEKSGFFPGVIRNYFERRTKMKWEVLASLIDEKF